MTFVGRNAKTLEQVAQELGIKAGIKVAATLEEMATAISEGNPRVVINTIGPFARTAIAFVNACRPGTHYLDIGNELPAFLSLFGMNDELVRTGRCVVPGAGWGVLGTESVVLKLCEGQPPAAKVRVDSVASVRASGLLGATVAQTIVEGIPYGGRRYANGKLKRALAGDDQEEFSLPDGSTAVTRLIATGELEAARRASGASDVVAAFPAVPGGLLRFIIPVVAPLLSIPAVRGFATARLATLVPPASKTEISWARARVEWPDGSVRIGWLRAGDGYDFLAKVSAGVAQRLLDGQGRPGYFTPGALFGTQLAVDAGGTFVLEEDVSGRKK
ncbi:putative integral membrane protein [Granulicella sibirica]|uniref:Putative integral membrane protein n=2 Tax=Granulicella sibirica TaxID=2479048 RepID=A0A4Q0T2F9_9BACT|nr:putative integral membrane protein [Granulicella sibirica]